MSTVSSSTSSTTTSTSSSSNSVSSTDYLSFDTESLVEAKLSPYYTRLDSYNSQVTANETKISAYGDLQDLLQEFQGYLEELRSDPSSSGQEEDVFLARQAYLTSSDGTSSSTYMAATVEAGTDLSTHTITINKIAKSNILASEDVSSRTTALGWTGTINVGTDAGTSSNIIISDGMSLGDIVDTINAESSTSGVTASIMKQSDTSYIMVLTSNNTGETITLSDVSGSLLSTSSQLGMIDSTSGDVESGNILQNAQDAELVVDNVTLTRSSNDIDDILDGVTMHLYAPTTSSLSLEVDNNLSSVKTSIQNFVTAYNAFREVVLANQATNSDGTASDSATLWADNILRSISTNLQSIMSSSVDDSTGGLAQLGITFDADNNLVLDTDTLDEVLLDDFDAIQSLFSMHMTASTGDLTLVRAPNSSLDFTLDVIVDASGNLTGASVGGDSSLFTISGSVIKGATGTIYEGLSLLYTGETSKSIDVTLSQGLADQMYYAVDAVANEDDGSITAAVESLQNSNDDLDNKISSLEETISNYSDSLYTLYGNIAAKLAEADTTVTLLKALLSADSNN